MALLYGAVFYTEQQRGGWLVGLTPAPGGLAYAGILGSPSGVTGGRLVALLRRADHGRTCPFIGVKRSR